MTKKSNNIHSGDTTISDIHKIRERISDSFNGDIHAISAAARKRQEQSGRTTVSYAKDKNKPTR